MEKYYLDKPGKKPYTSEKIESIIMEINDAKSTGAKKRRDYYILQKYDVLTVAEKKYLIHKKKEDKEDIMYIVAYEDLFEKLSTYHIRTGHGGIGKMRAVLSNKYSIPRPAIETFLSICATCNSKKGVNRKLVIKPIINHHTKFISLLPLESKRAVEVASNLLTVFLTFGAPKILQCDNGREFVNSIINEIKELWPECIIVHGRPRHLQSQGSIERSNQDVENMLRAWMKDNKTKKCSIGLKFVQFQKNSSHHRIIGRSPYKALFGCDPKVGLSTSNLPLEVIKKLTAEEDLEEIYSKYENENIEQSILVKYCKMCKNESTEDVCDLCKTNNAIHEERKAGHKGQEKAAEKMLQVSNAVIPEFKINDCITISVPKVDRGPSDPARVIAVIIEEKNEMYKIGTTHGLIKGWFNSRSMQHATANFILAEQVDKQKELTLCETVQVVSGGQGFLSCSCKSACQTKRYVCFKGGLKCNSRRHNSFSCSNK
ncbi:KRAB-A domain-containing protein 2-like [Acyrthosiphon pisum]|uniref:Integrase catalytic domain-containing protein n=1 Tax=Acyrthosiphon pisum TaxID=7029 RepID=A0A8R2AYG3_ACYPI|nr:KRAB-A domain-containing protein 2-like [Acyrthosiphon pisum]|eukprot:XP_008178550.1 PREDICTED: KRAB-A domain-containing protein 2-like [Acyrthosiphon pisum]